MARSRGATRCCPFSADICSGIPRAGIVCGACRPPLVSYIAVRRDRGRLKSRVIRAVMGGEPRRDIDAWADIFVGGLERRGAFRPAGLATVEAHRRAGDRLVLLSASPDLYVPRIGRLLGFERTLCTEVKWQGHPPEDLLDGALQTPNRRGDEKTRCLALLRAEYGLPVIAYGNSASDLPHLRLADKGLLVNGGVEARPCCRGRQPAGCRLALATGTLISAARSATSDALGAARSRWSPNRCTDR